MVSPSAHLVLLIQLCQIHTALHPPSHPSRWMKSGRVEREAYSFPRSVQSVGRKGMPAREDCDEVQVHPREGKQGQRGTETPANPSLFSFHQSARKYVCVYSLSLCVQRYNFLIQNSFLSAHANMCFIFPNLSWSLHASVDRIRRYQTWPLERE